MEDRKGARRIEEIPSDVLEKLNRGELQTVNLTEWLAIDHPSLLAAALPACGLGQASSWMLPKAHQIVGSPITKRLAAVGRWLHRALSERGERGSVERERAYEALATHRSDMVRAWASLSDRADPGLDLAERIGHAMRFSMDESMAVREIAWDSFRPALAMELGRGLDLLQAWTGHEHEGPRRAAIEGTRPRGVWTPHIPALKADPAPALPLLEALRSDPSRYVQNAVANWLNDASKDHPEWVLDLTRRWREESPSKETNYIVRRGLRTLRKRGEG